MKNILLIGLGRFGRHVAIQLNDLGHEVMAVDNNEERVNEVLPFADEETVRRVVRETIDVGIKGSGYILSTCNILTRDVPLRNAVAMYDEAEKYQL
mgnify:CR=1 FL=1